MINMMQVNETNGQHTAMLTQRELATLRVIAYAMLSDVEQSGIVGDALNAIAGDCGNDNCEACSLDGDDAHDVRDALYGE